VILGYLTLFNNIGYFETLLQAPGSTGVAPYHDKYIKPLTERFEKNKV
jgi:hypothetical protein